MSNDASMGSTITTGSDGRDSNSRANCRLHDQETAADGTLIQLSWATRSSSLADAQKFNVPALTGGR